MLKQIREDMNDVFVSVTIMLNLVNFASGFYCSLASNDTFECKN